MVQGLVTTILNRRRNRPNSRAPKAQVVEGVTRIVSALMANLHAFHNGPRLGDRLAIPAAHRKTTRYDRPGFGQLPIVVRELAELGHIKVHPAVPKVRRMGIEAQGELLANLKSTGTQRHHSRAEGEEVIWLMARGLQGQPASPVDYPETTETIALRAEVQRITSHLARQRIELHGSVMPPAVLARRFLLRQPSDPPAFKLHGRLYGAFWESLPARERIGLRINGEPVADLDFASMFPALAYAQIGIAMPDGDPYGLPGLEKHRAGVKAALSAVLASQRPLMKLPSDIAPKLPGWCTARRFREVLLSHHPALAPLLYRDCALELMFTESQILMRVLATLVEAGIPALPMHDGIMVAASQVQAATTAMVESSKAELGLPLRVTRKM